MKSPKVTIHNSDSQHKVRVAVYRHTTTPGEISIHILSIHSVIPPEPVETDIAKVIGPGGEIKVEAEILKTVNLG